MSCEDDQALVHNITLEIDDQDSGVPKPPPRHHRHRKGSSKRLIGTNNQAYEGDCRDEPGPGPHQQSKINLSSSSGSSNLAMVQCISGKPVEKEGQNDGASGDVEKKEKSAESASIKPATSSKTGPENDQLHEPVFRSSMRVVSNGGKGCCLTSVHNELYCELKDSQARRNSGKNSIGVGPKRPSNTSKVYGNSARSLRDLQSNTSVFIVSDSGLGNSEEQRKYLQGKVDDSIDCNLKSKLISNVPICDRLDSDKFLSVSSYQSSECSNLFGNHVPIVSHHSPQQLPHKQSGHKSGFGKSSSADTFAAQSNHQTFKRRQSLYSSNQAQKHYKLRHDQSTRQTSNVKEGNNIYCASTLLSSSNAHNLKPVTSISTTESSNSLTSSGPGKFSIGSSLPKTVKSVRKIGVFYSDLCDVIRELTVIGTNVMKSNNSNNNNSVNNNDSISNNINSNSTNNFTNHQQTHIISTNNENITNVIIGDTTNANEIGANYPNNCANPVTISVPLSTTHASTTTNINSNHGHVNLIECDTTLSSSNVNTSSAHPNSSSSSSSYLRNNISTTNANQQLGNLPDILNSCSLQPPPYNQPPPPYSTLPPASSSFSANLRSLLVQHLNVSPTLSAPQPPPTSGSSQQISFLLPPSPPWEPQNSYLSPSSVPIPPPPPHSAAHHHHRGLACLRRGCSRESDAETTTTKSCLTCTGLSIRWFILLVSFIGLVCAVIGTFLGAARPLGKEHLTLALLMIGIGIVLIIVSGIAWRLTSTGPTWRALFGFSDGRSSSGLHGNSLETTSRHFLPRVPAPHGRSGAHHHPYGAMFYPEFQYRQPPPSYQASMAEYRLRLLLLERSSNAPQATSASSTISPPPSYRSSSANTSATTATVEVNVNCD